MSASSHLKCWKLHSTFIWLYQLHTFVQMSTVEYDKVLLNRANKWTSKGHDCAQTCVTLIQNNRGKGKLYPPSPKHWLQLQSHICESWRGCCGCEAAPTHGQTHPDLTWGRKRHCNGTQSTPDQGHATRRLSLLFFSYVMWCDWVLIIATSMYLLYQSDASNRDVNTDMWHWTNRPLAPQTW